MHSKIHCPFLSLPLPIQTLRFLSCKKAPLNSNRRSVSGKFMSNFITERLMFVSKLRSVRCVTLFLGIYNLAVVFLAGFLMASIYPGCGTEEMLPFAMVGVMSCIRIMSMIGTGFAQEATASIIVSQQQAESSVVDAVIRHERRMSYKRWLWWTRFGTVICILQIFGATYLMYIVVKYVSYDGKSSGCFLGNNVDHSSWKWKALVVFLILLWLLVITQCFAGSDVLRWRSFYATRDDAWKAHYREVFDHGIREALCCLGRVKYLSALEEDEVHSVAKLLGDLVAYRASGTGHLELLAGLALLQRHRQKMNSYEELTKAPESVIREAVTFHPFAEAAYTGPLLDVGRNPMLFPCVWLYRQGVLMPWSWNRRPVLEGDNWWRGHAAAFLKYVNLSPEALRRGRVSQVKREAAYFVVVLHHLRTIVIAVRGTETPEDLITDGLCRECPLLTDDVDGLIKKEFIFVVNNYFIEPFSSWLAQWWRHSKPSSENLPPDVGHSVLSSFPHYGHSGIVEAARELFMQIDGQPGDRGNCSSETNGFLSSLLGAGCECHGYNIRIVGHSLGGAIATMLGLRLYRRYPNLHVYSYGSLPCVDYIIAEACSSFVTSIVYNDEFSARLSVSSILRLRASAIAALSQDASANSAMICNLARRLLKLSKCQEKVQSGRIPTSSLPASDASADVSNHIYRRRHYKYAIKGGVFLCAHAVSCLLNMPNPRPCFFVKDEDHGLSSDLTLEPKGVSDKNSSAFTAGVGEPGQQLLVQEPTASTDNQDLEILTDRYNEYSQEETGSSYSDILREGFDKSNKDSSDMMSMCIQPFYETAAAAIAGGDSVSQLVDGVSSTVEVLNGEHQELFLAGLVIHIVPEQVRSIFPLWKGWKVLDRDHRFQAYIANRESFKDIVVSPYMFLDHLPWRCRYAMQRVLESCKTEEGQSDTDLPNRSDIV